ncbi:MAG: DNA repair protein RecN [Terriglobia bacterium]
MLREIHIRNYAVVESLSLEFFPGLNLLSGETGSGKSILVDALGLALGDRASPDVIRTGQERATVTAVFQVGGVAKAWLAELGLGGAGEAEVILRREIQIGGKSRLLVNDQPVTLAAVRGLARRLVDIHGQNEHVALLTHEAQLDLLDQFARLEASAEEVGKLFRRRLELEREMERSAASEQERLRALDVLKFQIDELEAAHLELGEDERLAREREIQTNVEKIRAAAGAAFAHLYDEEGSACSRLAQVARALDELARYDSSAAALSEPLAATRATIEDLSAFFRNYLSNLESDPRRLDEVEERLAQIDRLKRKYGQSIEEILAYAERAAKQLETYEHADERRSQLAGDLERAKADYQQAARALSQERHAAAMTLAKRIRPELGQVGMEKTRFEIRLTNVPKGDGGPRGIDDIEILISPNPGEEVRPLERTASGGELSRLMLALKTVVASGTHPATEGDGEPRAAAFRQHTFIFDEVDAGIGGRVAECVGQRLKRLARTAQVLCVTHLPQIACFADHHYYVEKSQRGGRTVTEVRLLTTERERAAELARMLSGSQITDAVLKHAAAMLRQAGAAEIAPSR